MKTPLWIYFVLSLLLALNVLQTYHIYQLEQAQVQIDRIQTEILGVHTDILRQLAEIEE